MATKIGDSLPFGNFKATVIPRPPNEDGGDVWIRVDDLLDEVDPNAPVPDNVQVWAGDNLRDAVERFVDFWGNAACGLSVPA